MEKLMYEGLANIGDTIRGYDWTPISERKTCYIEGVVTAMSRYAYQVKLTKKVVNGKDRTNLGEILGQTFHIPFESSDDKYWLEEYHKLGLTGRVEKIRDAE